MKPAKTKEQVINAYENRVVLKFIIGMVLIAGIALAVILADGSNHTKSTTALVVSFVVALSLLGFALRCPLCDSLKSPERIEIGVFNFETGFFQCKECNVSNEQVRKYVDLLKRGVDIDGDVIAKLHKREL